MNVQQIEFSKEQAHAALLQYKEHRGNYDKADWEIERIYRAIARGKIVISASQAIIAAGLDEQGRPRLAIARADAGAVECYAPQSSSYPLEFSGPRPSRWNFKVPMQTPKYQRIMALLPRIPPQYRPEPSKLKDYWLLWEADWTSIPVDPYLLRRIGRDAWIVLAAWELTPVEIAVLRPAQ
jgi:hypothetical protein